jgi:hypothetical protein
MSQTVTLYRVFIASPSDVPDCRQTITEAVYHYNRTFTPTSNIALEPVKWETHGVPDSVIQGRR